ncbi:g protein-coupled receptor-related [Anaeramoeba ignava]|uniref:G protein-coupled receptor-related n=1 Tax=Anaeramoeba ignava TaxID=1746090 RepID=A0A9Q0RDN7_ANAIG|nr:g protein-coupled receptor-related [Anaeramoeba ignava]
MRMKMKMKMKFILTINLILFFNYFLFSIKSETINVNWLGGEDISNCGVSSNPNCSTIKYAIEKRINDNDILFIYEGNYYSNSCNITSFDISFQIQAENVTLDCENILPAFLFDFSNNTDNGNITIKGLTIKNADNSNQESIIFSGAGITVNKGKVWIESCSFLNSFSNGSETFPRSAGIYLDSPRYLSINNSNFSNLYNTNATASAIFILNQENLTEPQTFIMESCTFNENYVETQGSTIISFSNENEVLYDYIFTNNTFENNFADYSGVFFLKIIPQENSSIIIAKNTFFNNTGQQGGITFVTMTDLYNLTIRIDGNNFTQNIGIYESSSIKFHPNAIKDWNLGSFEFVNNLIFEDNGYESNIDLSFGFNFTKFDLIIENNNFTSNIILSAAPIMISSSLIDNQVNFSFISNNFVNNTGIDTLSGGIFIYDEFALNGSQKYFFINNTFINNTGQRSAGGIMLLHPKILGGSYALFENNTFENNIGPIGGLLYYSYADSYNNTFEFVGNTFRNNIGNVYSGAIYFVLLSDFFDFNCTFTNNIFEKNTGWSGAGAIFFDFAASAQGINIELFGNTFINNSGGQGGDLSIRNDLLSTQNFSGIFEDNIFEMSSSDSGGSLFFDTLSNLSIQNCEFINNYAVEGGSILVRGQTELTINNTNFSQNNGMFGSTILSFSREKTTIINSILNTPNDSGKIGYFENIESILENTTITCGEGYIYQNSTSTKYKNDIEVISYFYECVPCPQGSYSMNYGGNFEGAMNFCFKCPYGATCNGINKITPLSGFWGFPTNSSQFLEYKPCPTGYCTIKTSETESISSGDYNYCSGNRKGILCGECEEGYTNTLSDESECVLKEDCQGGLGYYLFLALIKAVIYSLILLFKPQDDSGSFIVAVYFFQMITYVLPQIRKDPDEKDQASQQFASILQFISDLVNLKASFPTLKTWGNCPNDHISSVEKIAYNLVGPAFYFGVLLLFVLIYYLIVYLKKKRKQKKQRKKEKEEEKEKEESLKLEDLNNKQNQQINNENQDNENEMNENQENDNDNENKIFDSKETKFTQKQIIFDAFLTLFILTYTNLSETTLNLLNCIPIKFEDGHTEKRLYFSGNVKCYNSWQIFLFFIVILIGLFPFLILIWKRWAKKKYSEKLKKKKSPYVEVMIFILEAPFVKNCKYWRSFYLFRRFAIIVIFVFVIDPFIKSFIISMICLIILLLTIILSPFHNKRVMKMEYLSLSVLVIFSIMTMRDGSLASAGVDNELGSLKDTTLAFNVIGYILTITVLLFALINFFIGFRSQIKSYCSKKQK